MGSVGGLMPMVGRDAAWLLSYLHVPVDDRGGEGTMEWG